MGQSQWRYFAGNTVRQSSGGTPGRWMRSKTVAACLVDLINIFVHIFHIIYIYIYIIQFFLIYKYGVSADPGRRKGECAREKEFM